MQAAHAGHDNIGRKPAAVGGGQLPVTSGIIPVESYDLRIEMDTAGEAMLRRNPLQVSQDLRLRSVGA